MVTRADPVSVESPAPSVAPPTVGARRPRLAVVEDDADLRELLRLVMEPAGWEVIMAPSAALGMVAIDARDPDVVLLDLGLPDASGLDVLGALRADEHTAWVPVVVLSGDHDPASATSALVSGAQDFITKPFVAEELQARLVAALRVATAHRAVADAEERFRLTFEEAPIGIALLTPDGEWLWVNRAMCEILGYEERALRETPFSALTHPDDRQRDLTLTREVLAGELDRFQVEKRYRHADGHTVWAHLSMSLVRDDAGSPRHLVAQVQDITTLHEAREQLRHQSLHDPLTGLANRVLLFDRLRHALFQEARHHRGLAVLFLDLDQLKAVNDELGHDAGDALLVHVSNRMHHAVRDGDTVARVGGDEFVVVAEAIGGTSDALELAERLRVAVGEPCTVHGVEVTCTASIGVTVPRPGQRPEDILREADRAMYQAKAEGKDRLVLVDESHRVPVPSPRGRTDRTW